MAIRGCVVTAETPSVEFLCVIPSRRRPASPPARPPSRSGRDSTPLFSAATYPASNTSRCSTIAFSNGASSALTPATRTGTSKNFPSRSTDSRTVAPAQSH